METPQHPQERAAIVINDYEEALTLIENTIIGRKEVITETQFSDPRFKEFAQKYDGNLLQHIEEELFSDTNKQIGHGNTAKVHELDTRGDFDPVAVKYLIKPQNGTVSARVEHNIILEVERIGAIERRLDEITSVTKHIRVPHPYFHHSTDKIQCYGMEKIDGVNLQAAIEGIIPNDLQESLKNNDFESIELSEIESEIDIFFEAVHSYCLHGSVKPDNMMISRTGQIFIVDFGNSILNSDDSAADQSWLAAKQEDEVKAAKLAVREFLITFRELRSQAA